MTLKDPKWDQENPRDQIKAALETLRGWIANLEDGTSTPERVAEAVRDACERIESYTRVPDMDRWPDKRRSALLCRALDMAFDQTIPMRNANDNGEALPEGWEREALDELHKTAQEEWLRHSEVVTTTLEDLIDTEQLFKDSDELLKKYEDPNKEAP